MFDKNITCAAAAWVIEVKCTDFPNKVDGEFIIPVKSNSVPLQNVAKFKQGECLCSPCTYTWLHKVQWSDKRKTSNKAW